MMMAAEEIASQSVQHSKNPQHQLRRFNLLLIIRRCHLYSSIYIAYSKIVAEKNYLHKI